MCWQWPWQAPLLKPKRNSKNRSWATQSSSSCTQLSSSMLESNFQTPKSSFQVLESRSSLQESSFPWQPSRYLLPKSSTRSLDLELATTQIKFPGVASTAPKSQSCSLPLLQALTWLRSWSVRVGRESKAARRPNRPSKTCLALSSEARRG